MILVHVLEIITKYNGKKEQNDHVSECYSELCACLALKSDKAHVA